MRAVSMILMLLILMAACATTEGNKSDPQLSYGGTYRVRGTSGSGK